VNPIAVDPMAFDRKDDGERAEIFKKLVPFDFAANKKKNDAFFDLRADVKRDLKREQGALASLLVADVPPFERIDEAALLQELQDAGTTNADIATRKNNRTQAEQRVETLRSEADDLITGITAAADREKARAQSTIEDYERQIRDLQDRITLARSNLGNEIERIDAEARRNAQAKRDEADALQKRLDEAKPLGDTIDVDAIRARLNDAKTRNQQFDAWKQLHDRKLETQQKVEALQAEADDLTAQLTELEQERTSAIQKAHLPIDGLGFNEGIVTLNGKPWKHGSEAERIDASMALAMALQPKLRNIIIRDASGVGSKIRQRITDRARAAGYRVVLEVLDESGANSTVLIENGAVKKLAEKAAQEVAA
jgi:DNA repair exonuclease SbcCD ATPase subunit